MQQIYRRTPIPKCDFNKIALQLYWNHTSARVFSCKFAAYLQNTFFYEHLRTAASGYRRYRINSQTQINFTTKQHLKDWENHYQKQLSRGVLKKRCSVSKYEAHLLENTHVQVWFQLSCFATLLKSHFGMGVLL